MNPKWKNLLINSMVGTSIMLFIISFVVGQRMETEKAAMHAARQSSGESFTYSSASAKEDPIKDETGNEPKSDLQRMEPNEDLREVIRKGTDGEKVSIRTYSEFFSKEEIQDSKEVARKFMESYYRFDGNKPTKHVDKAKKYMTRELYSLLSEEIPRPTIRVFEKELDRLELYEPYDVNGERLVWVARIHGTVYGQDGKKSKDEVVEYRLVMAKEAGLKVDDVSITLSN